jgi:hypothetical protein
MTPHSESIVMEPVTDLAKLQYWYKQSDTTKPEAMTYEVKKITYNI